MNEHVYAFLDTGIFLHYPPIQDVDWCQICNSKSVCIVLCLPVIEELDQKSHEAAFRSRAERAIKDIRKYKSENNVRSGVSFLVYTSEPKYDGINDGRIIQCIKQFEHEHSDSEVVIIAEDVAFEFRCDASGVRYIRMDSSRRLDDPDDEVRKEMRKLQEENLRLKARQPKLSLIILPLGVEPTKDISAYECVLKQQWETHDIDKEIEELKQKYPLHAARTSKSSGTSLGVLARDVMAYSISQESWEGYDKDLEKFYAEYETYLHEASKHNEVLARTFAFDLWMVNDGTAPATDIDFHMTFPEAMYVCDAERMLLQPTKPSPPERPKPSFFSTTSDLFVREPSFRFPRIEQPMIDRIVKILPSQEGGVIVSSHASRLKHDKPWLIGSFRAIFSDWESIRPFQVPFVLSASEITSAKIGRIPFKVSLADDGE